MKRSASRTLKAVIIIVVWSLLLVVAYAVRRREIDFDALEKAWEAGDAEPELRTEGDEQYQRLSQKLILNPEEAKAMGPQMVFVTLRGGPKPHQKLATIASRWKEMLWNGGIEANIYEIEGAKLLVGLQKGLYVGDLHRFLLEQQEVKEFEWNGETYSAIKSIKKSDKSKKHHKKHSSHAKFSGTNIPAGQTEKTEL